MFCLISICTIACNVDSINLMSIDLKYCYIIFPFINLGCYSWLAVIGGVEVGEFLGVVLSSILLA